MFITNVMVGGYIVKTLSNFIAKLTKMDSVWIVFIVAVVVLIFLIVLGVLVPKRIGMKYPEKTLYKYCKIVLIITSILIPVTFVVTSISHAILRMIGLNPNENLDNVTEEEIITMVNEGQEIGVLEAGEAEMITNIFEFGDKEAHDVMIHRSNIVAIEAQTNLEDAFKFMLDNNFSRYPIYDEVIDNIVGMLYFRDAAAAYLNDKRNDIPVSQIPNLLREAYLVPETRNVDALFKEMQAKKQQIAVVVDEYGQTSGLITMEDIIEEIVGNIQDEYDMEAEQIEKKADNSYEVDGFTLLDDLEDLLKIEFSDDDYETINGFMISMLHRLPSDDEQSEVEYGGYLFKVLEASNKVIRKVKITKLNKQEDEIDGDSDK